MTARKRKGAGRPPKSAALKRSVKRAVLLLPSEAAAHDEARGDAEWSDWIREAAELAIAVRSARHQRLTSEPAGSAPFTATSGGAQFLTRP